MQACIIHSSVIHQPIWPFICFFHSFIFQIFIKCQLCAQCDVDAGNTQTNKTKNPCPHGAYILVPQKGFPAKT